jgi:hypothetical protein
VIRNFSWLHAYPQAIARALVVLGISSIAHVWAQSGWPSYPNNATIAIANGGNVGIGTSVPSSALHELGNNGINGTSAFFSIDSAHSGIAMANNGTIGYIQGQSAANGSIANLGLQLGGGIVGIGTTTPDQPLTLKLTSAGAPTFFKISSTIAPSFSTYLGTTASKQYSWGTNIRYDGSAFVRVDSTKTGWRIAQVVDGDTLSVNHWDLGGVLTTPFQVSGGGNVGIGTLSPQSKLAVAGVITAKEVVVTNTGWANYVFAPGYALAPLPDIKEYVRTHQHLAEVPAAKEVEERGVSVGEMQAKLLAKVEELTLYAIQEHERNEQLAKDNREFSERLSRLEARLH